MLSAELLVKRVIKTTAAVSRKFRTVEQNSVKILGYHRVVRDIERAEKNSIYGLVVSKETFRKHCLMLMENFEIVTLQSAANSLENKNFTGKPKAVITFDDGYLDNYVEAYPILKELGLPATIFLPTDLIGSGEILSHDKAFWLSKNLFEQKLDFHEIFKNFIAENNLTEHFAGVSDVLTLTDKIVYLPVEHRDFIINKLEYILAISEYPSEYALMNWEQIREMNKNGINFGNHTATHPILPLENETAFADEIFTSKEILEKELGKTVYSFAYPNGQYNENVRRQIIKAGYKFAVTTEKRINKIGEDLFALGRTCYCEESTRGIAGVYSPKVAEFRFSM